MKKCYTESGRNGISYIHQKEGRLTGLVTSFFLKHVVEGKIEGMMKVMGRRGRRRKQMLDDLRKREDTG
jgi:hypothetical protein